MVDTAWNPADKTGITLSNSDRTATSTAFNYNGVRAINPKHIADAEKVYVEFTLSGCTDSRDTVGFTILTKTLGSNDYAQEATVIGEDGVMSPSGGSLTGGINNKTVGAAIDLGAKKIWYTVDGATWWGGSSPDPATNSGGAAFGAGHGSNDLYLYATIISDHGVVTLNAGKQPLAFAPPAGFTTYDPSDAAAIISPSINVMQ
jgi:hypothetical protein